MNFNKAIVVGNLTRDPESRSTPSGNSVSNFSIATNRTWVDQSGQKQTKAEFHNIVAWGKLADICSQYLKKGSLVLIEGRIETRSWEAPDGAKKYRTEIIAEGMQMGPRSSQSSQGDFKKNAENEDNASPQETGQEDIELKDIPF